MEEKRVVLARYKARTNAIRFILAHHSGNHNLLIETEHSKRGNLFHVVVEYRKEIKFSSAMLTY